MNYKEINKTKFENWQTNDRSHCYHDTSLGRYVIQKYPKGRFTLSLSGRIIGIHRDPLSLRRLAKADYNGRLGVKHG